MNLVNPAIKTMHEKCENKRVKTMCNTEICYSMYKLSPSSVAKDEYIQLQNKYEREYGKTNAYLKGGVYSNAKFCYLNKSHPMHGGGA